MAKGTRKTKKTVKSKTGTNVPKKVIARYNSLSKSMTAFGKLIGAV